MSTRVYLSTYPSPPTPEEDTPVWMRRPRSRATVTDLYRRLQPASQCDDVRLVRRPTVWIALLVQPGPVAVLRARGGLSPAWLSPWRQAFRLRGLARWVSRHGGGRRPPLTPRQNKRWVERMEAGPRVGGCEPAGGTAVLLRVLLWRECGVLSKRQYGGPLRHTWGGVAQGACGLGPARRGPASGVASGPMARALSGGPAVARPAPLCRGSQVCAVGLAALDVGPARAPACGPHAGQAQRLQGVGRHGGGFGTRGLSGHRGAGQRSKGPSVSGDEQGPNHRAPLLHPCGSQVSAASGNPAMFGCPPRSEHGRALAGVCAG
jgi:hypothetical protein